MEIAIGKKGREEMDKFQTLQQIEEQLESCEYETEAGVLKNNIAFLRLKEMADAENSILDKYENAVHQYAVLGMPGAYDILVNGTKIK